MWVEDYRGKYRAFERYVDPMTLRQKKVSVIMEKDTKKERKIASEILREKINQAIKNGNASDDIRLGELVEKYLAINKMNWKDTTYRRNGFECKLMIQLLGADTVVSNLKAGWINEQLVKSGRNATSLNEWIKRFKIMIRWAYSNDYIDNTRCVDKLSKFRERSQREKLLHKYLEPDELKLVLDSMEVEKWRLITELMVHSGMRIGEVIALNDKDVDIENGYISIDKTYDMVNKITTDAKTDTSKRLIVIQPRLQVICQNIRVFMKNHGKVMPIKNRLFVHNAQGGYIEYYSYNKYLKEVSERVVPHKTVTTHVLRHTHTSLYMAEGFTLGAMSARLGHASTKITDEVYTHKTNLSHQRDRELLYEVDRRMQAREAGLLNDGEEDQEQVI